MQIARSFNHWASRFLLIFITVLSISSCASAAQKKQQAQQNANKPSEQFSNVLYNLPAGWQSSQQQEALLLTPKNLKGNQQGSFIIILPGQDYTGNFRAWFENLLTIAHKDGRVVASEGINETMAEEGFPLIFYQEAFEDSNGTRSLRFYVAAHPGSRVETVGYFATDVDSYNRYKDVFEQFLKSLDFANWDSANRRPRANPGTSTGNNSEVASAGTTKGNSGVKGNDTVKGNGLNGLYVATISTQQFNVNTKFYDYIVRQVYYLFLPDGRVYNALPKGGSLNNFDFARAQREDPNNCGTYQIYNGEINFRWANRPANSFVAQLNGDRIKLGSNLFYKVSNAEGVKLNGVYAVRTFTNTSSATSTGGVAGERKITFTGDGRFQEEGFTGFVGSGANAGAASSQRSNGSGSYRISGNTLELRYSDGRQSQVTFFVYPENVQEARPGLIVIDGVSLLLR